LHVVLDARPDVVGHNVETVEDLYRRVRPVASYTQSLRVLEESSRYRDERAAGMRTKSGIMVGLGETTEQLVATIRDIAGAGCDIITIGQYLSPKRNSLQVEKFYTPEEFDFLRDKAREFGIKHAESAPLVRSFVSGPWPE
ncbi:MAG: lipoyl synthase, partial [bacterium]